MNKFNLTFKGEILPGEEPERVKSRFGKMFAINDPVRLERFFSGESIILRRNLERKAAAEYFQKLRRLGVEAQLVKVTAQQAAAAITDAPPPPPPSSTASSTSKPATVIKRGMDKDILQRQPGRVDQSWAVSASNAGPETAQRQQARAAAERIQLEQQQAEQIQRRAAEEAAQQDALRQEAQREAAEQAAKRQAAEEAAKQKALEEEARRKAAEEAARQQALEEEARRKAAEEAARQQALKEEARRKAAEEAARQKALKEEAIRKAAEEAARQQALKEEARRKAAEEAAKQKALKEEARRKAAEEAAKQKALKEEARRKAAEEAAKQKALKEEARRKAAEEAALLKAERQRKKAEQKRAKAEQAARDKARQLEAKHKAAQEAAKRKAELAEQKRQAAEESKRQQALLEETQAKAAAETARLEAEQQELARKAVAQADRLRAEQQLADAERKTRKKAKRKALALQEKETVRRKAAAKQALRKKEKRLAQADREQAASRAARQSTAQQGKAELQLNTEHEEQAAQRKVMEDLTVRRAAEGLTQQAALKPVKARVKTKLELPQRATKRRQVNGTSIARQPGAPNLFSLQPFRNTPDIRARADQSRQLSRYILSTALLALAALLILGGRFLSLPATQTVTGASAFAIDPQARPVLLAGNTLLLHDRSGIGTATLQLEALGIAALQAPMAFNAAGELLALGRLQAEDAGTGEEPAQLLRCSLEESRCRAFSAALADSTVVGFAIHPLDGSVFLADTAAGQLLKVSAAGELLLTAEVALPDRPVLRLQSGLLFINSAAGPAISVFRYDDSAFGQQLDEVLLLPPGAVQAEQSRVRDFVWTPDSWWASMYNPETNSAGLYRFDAQWNALQQLTLPAGAAPEKLARWGEKTLVGDARRVPIQRFNNQGDPEVPLISDLLERLVAQTRRSEYLSAMAWRLGLLLCTLVTVIGVCLGSLQRARALVYKPHRERGAEPVDEYASAVRWIDPVSDRRARLRRTGSAYAVLVLALLLLAVGQSVTVSQLTALLLAASGPAIALLLFSRSPSGHIGVLQQQLLLVDYTHMYHLGGGSRLQYRGPFLLIDDVVVFTGTRLLPAFSRPQILERVAPLANEGIRVDRKTIFVKLLQCRHPLARGAVAVLATSGCAVALLFLQSNF